MPANTSVYLKFGTIVHNTLIDELVVKDYKAVLFTVNVGGLTADWADLVIRKAIHTTSNADDGVIKCASIARTSNHDFVIPVFSDVIFPRILTSDGSSLTSSRIYCELLNAYFPLPQTTIFNPSESAGAVQRTKYFTVPTNCISMGAVFLADQTPASNTQIDLGVFVNGTFCSLNALINSAATSGCASTVVNFAQVDFHKTTRTEEVAVRVIYQANAANATNFNFRLNYQIQ